jgi:hypothetical protein
MRAQRKSSSIWLCCPGSVLLKKLTLSPVFVRGIG